MPDEMAPALLWRQRFNEQGDGTGARKRMGWEVMNRICEKETIGKPQSQATSVSRLLSRNDH